MSKSTPINQLPNILMNDPQRGAVPQQAPMPSADDIIQETLSQLQQTAQPQPPQQPQPPLPPQTPQMQPLPQYMEPPPSQYEYYYEDDQSAVVADPKEKLMLDFFNSDIKVALIAAACFILVSMLPVDKLVYQYIDLQKVPYSGVVIKAVIMFVVIYLLQRHFR
jgi:hypothetical protein